MKTHFRDLAPQVKKDMKGLHTDFKKAKLPYSSWLEGLRVLSGPNRESAASILSDSEYSKNIGFITTWGEGHRPRLALDPRHAKMLYDLSLEIHSISGDEEQAEKMLDTTMSVLLNGQSLPQTFTDPSWERLRQVLTEVEPILAQSTLF